LSSVCLALLGLVLAQVTKLRHLKLEVTFDYCRRFFEHNFIDLRAYSNNTITDPTKQRLVDLSSITELTVNVQNLRVLALGFPSLRVLHVDQQYYAELSDDDPEHIDLSFRDPAGNYTPPSGLKKITWHVHDEEMVTNMDAINSVLRSLACATVTHFAVQLIIGQSKSWRRDVYPTSNLYPSYSYSFLIDNLAHLRPTLEELRIDFDKIFFPQFETTTPLRSVSDFPSLRHLHIPLNALVGYNLAVAELKSPRRRHLATVLPPEIETITIVAPRNVVGAWLTNLYNDDTRTHFPKLVRINLDCRSYTGLSVDRVIECCAKIVPLLASVGIQVSCYQGDEQQMGTFIWYSESAKDKAPPYAGQEVESSSSDEDEDWIRDGSDWF
jgi:hypothetical protein